MNIFKEMTYQIRIGYACLAASRLGIFAAISRGENHVDQWLNDAGRRRVIKLLVASQMLTIENQHVCLGASLQSLTQEEINAGCALLEFYFSSYVGQAMQQVAPAILQGKHPFHLAFGKDIFDFFDNHAEERVVFNRAMRHDAKHRIRALFETFPFQEYGTIADIGGGMGHILGGILAQHPEGRGVLFDQPATVVEAKKELEKEAVSERINFVAGDFFKPFHLQADVFMLYHILHDWGDDEARQILAHLEPSLRQNQAKLLIVDRVMDKEANDLPYTLMDFTMFALTTGGKERTLSEWQSLLQPKYDIEVLSHPDLEDRVIVATPSS